MPGTVFTHLVQRFCGSGAVLRFEGAPEHCPVCGTHALARPLAAHSISPADHLVDFAFQCPRFACRRVFVGEYARKADGSYALMAAAAPAFDAPEHAAVPWR